MLLVSTGFERDFIPYMEKIAHEVMTSLIVLPEYVSDERFNKPIKDYGYLTISRIKNSSDKFRYFDSRIVVRIGEPPQDKDAKYFLYSQEKGGRLFDHIDEGHVSSFMSRNPDANEWGGAVLMDDFIVSFSGLPELADEAFSLLFALKLKMFPMNIEWIDGRTEAIKSESNNPLITPLIEASRIIIP